MEGENGLADRLPSGLPSLLRTESLDRLSHRVSNLSGLFDAPVLDVSSFPGRTVASASSWLYDCHGRTQGFPIWPCLTPATAAGFNRNGRSFYGPQGPHKMADSLFPDPPKPFPDPIILPSALKDLRQCHAIAKSDKQTFRPTDAFLVRPTAL